MAEGDSIVRLARRLEPALRGREIAAATAPNPRSPLRRSARRLEGLRVESIETRGKHLLIHLDEGLSLHSHLGMNGSWRLDEGGGFGRPERTAWLLLDPGGARVAQFGGPTLRLVRRPELARDSRLASLGPDILAPEFDLEAAATRLRASGMEVGEALLDQTLVCGIGNIFKAEACFEAGIDPWRGSASLSRKDSDRLLATARKQMLEAVETGRRPGRVYRRAGRPCPRCRRSEVRSRPQGDDGRTTYWCPNCQI